MRVFLRLTLVGIVAAFLASAAHAKRETDVERGIREDTLLLGNQAEPKDLDPHVVTAYSDMALLPALFEGLTVLDEKTSQGIPAAAERWDVSSDGKKYTFHLRPGLVWSNGDPLTAEDFVWSFQRALTPSLAAESAYILWPIRNAEAFNTGKLTNFAEVGVRAVNALTLEVALERPAPYLPALAAHPTWLPVHRATLEKFGAAAKPGTPWTRPGHLVGNGPFQLIEWKTNVRVVVAKNPRYRDAASVRLQKIVFLPTENSAVEERDFRAGQTHLTAGVPTSKIATYRKDQPEALRSDPFLQTFYVNFNTTKPPFNDVRVRRAFALAVDRVTLATRGIQGGYLPAQSFTPPNSGGYTSRTTQKFDAATAKRLLAEAGFPGGAGFPTVELQVKNDELQPRVAEVLQANWQRELGVNVTIAQFEQKIWIENQSKLQHSLALITWIGDYVDPATFLGVPVSNSGNNWTGWSNAEYDRLVATANDTADNAQRLELFQQAEALLLDQAPIAPLFHGTRTYLIHPAVRGWEPALLGIHQYSKLWLEPTR